MRVADQIHGCSPYFEDHVKVIVFSNHFFQFDHIGMANLLQRLARRDSLSVGLEERVSSYFHFS